MPLGPQDHARDGYLLLTTAARLVQRRFDAALAPLGLTRAAVIALKGMSHRPMNQEQLAAAIHVQSQTLGPVLARLAAEGLVTRKRDPQDRRQFQVAITDAGEAALRAAREAESVALPTDFDGWEILREQLSRLLNTFPSPGQARESTRNF